MREQKDYKSPEIVAIWSETVFAITRTLKLTEAVTACRRPAREQDSQNSRVYKALLRTNDLWQPVASRGEKLIFFMGTAPKKLYAWAGEKSQWLIDPQCSESEFKVFLSEICGLNSHTCYSHYILYYSVYFSLVQFSSKF